MKQKVLLILGYSQDKVISNKTPVTTKSMNMDMNIGYGY